MIKELLLLALDKTIVNFLFQNSETQADLLICFADPILPCVSIASH